METKRLPLEIKQIKEREFEGYGSVFGNVDLGGDVVMQGAFHDTLKKHKKTNSLPVMMWMHDPSQIPGAWVEMHEDEKGLVVKGTLADTQLGNEIRTLLGMKAVRGLSIGFVIDEADYDEDGTRLIKKVDLWEVSVVSLPMNPKAQISHAKARLSANGEYVPTDKDMAALKREVEQFLKSKGLSKTQAIAYASKIFSDDGVILESRPDSGEILTAGQSDSAMEIELAAALGKLSEKMLADCVKLKMRI